MVPKQKRLLNSLPLQCLKIEDVVPQVVLIPWLSNVAQIANAYLTEQGPSQELDIRQCIAQELLGAQTRRSSPGAHTPTCGPLLWVSALKRWEVAAILPSSGNSDYHYFFMNILLTGPMPHSRHMILGRRYALLRGASLMRIGANGIQVIYFKIYYI